MPLLALVLAIIWIIALVSLCSRRDIDIHDKLSWVVTVLVLNALGALIYFFLGPKRQAADEPTIDLTADLGNRHTAVDAGDVDGIRQMLAGDERRTLFGGHLGESAQRDRPLRGGKQRILQVDERQRVGLFTPVIPADNICPSGGQYDCRDLFMGREVGQHAVIECIAMAAVLSYDAGQRWAAGGHGLHRSREFL